jgi:hypothetical protein
MVIDMFIKIRAQKRAIFQQPQTANADRPVGRDKRLHNQMILLMVSSVGIFFVTTLPLTIGHIVSVYSITDFTILSQFIINLTILNWIQSLNCAVSFFSSEYMKHIIRII